MEKLTFPQVMKGSAAISGCLTAVLVLAWRHCPSGFLLTLCITFGTTFYHFAMRLMVGTIVPWLAKGRIFGTEDWFRQREWEPTLYKRLRVKSWKDRMPTYDPGSYSLKENTLSQIITNMCVSELVHQVIVILSFLPLLVIPYLGGWPAFVITSVLAACLDTSFVILQRYNRPRLQRILQKHPK